MNVSLRDWEQDKVVQLCFKGLYTIAFETDLKIMPGSTSTGLRSGLSRYKDKQHLTLDKETIRRIK